MTPTGPPPRRTRDVPVVRGTALALGWSAAVGLLAGSADVVAPLADLRGLTGGTTSGDELVAAAAGALCWALLTAVALGVAVSAAAALPGRLGDAAAAVARTAVPVVVRRVVAGAAGAGVAAALLAPGAAAAAPLATSAPTPPPAAAEADLDWPEADLPASPVPAPGDDPAPTVARAGTGAPVADAVTVAPGDTLWELAAEHLTAQQGPEQPADTQPADAQVAAEWPRWWAANRDVVGADPDLLLPGQQLVPPLADPSAADLPGPPDAR